MTDSRLGSTPEYSVWECAMRRGDFEAAWRETDRVEKERRRLEKTERLVREPHHLLWNGDSFEGRDVVVRCHHGLGDTLQFVRFVRTIRERAKSVVVLAQPPLVQFLETQPGLGGIRDGWVDFRQQPHELAIEVMELAYAMRATPQTVGTYVPYLSAPPARSPQLSPRQGTQVGLHWAASDWDPRRSLPLAELQVLGRIPGVIFHSLQQGPRAEEWRGFPGKLTPLAEQTRQIDQAAAAMAQLDLIITVDGMVAHLAGALGRPVWVLLPREADWRWMADGNDSPWYPSMKLFRQRMPGDWAPVVEEVADRLAEWARLRSSSPGSIDAVHF